MAVSGYVGALADGRPGTRGAAEDASGRIASTRGTIAWFAWPVACRRQRIHRHEASDVRSWIGALWVLTACPYRCTNGLTAPLEPPRLRAAMLSLLCNLFHSQA